ncbi:MAG: hypothetical protein F9B45_27470 [Phycisphaera sp. RhM]|nr:hypothetical protein [Phycisphaera sp. RhM]
MTLHQSGFFASPVPDEPPNNPHRPYRLPDRRDDDAAGIGVGAGGNLFGKRLRAKTDVRGVWLL